ncbi:MAG TPA: HEAT repeat domain-containing protein [Planctomycetota bacterium]|nr:HEAT repeat domain-containing protein [Planctomycetota bacterium]
MRYASLLLLAGAAFADDQADAAVVPVIRDYYATLSGPTPSIESVRDRLVPLMKQLGPKTGPSVRNVIRRGFDKKYKKELPYLRCLCEILAAGGDPGINLLYKQYEGSKKDDALRAAMAEVLGACGDEEALDPLLKMAFDKTPEVAAAAVAACGKYPKVKEDTRKAAVKKLIELYGKVTDDAAGKAPDSTQMRMYEALRPAMNGTLTAFTGEALDSAAAFKAWFQENGTKPWSE